MRLTLHILVMPPFRAPVPRVMLNFPRTENNATPTTGDLEWQPVIVTIAIFLSILLAVYLLHLLFDFHASGVPHRVLSESLCSFLKYIYILAPAYVIRPGTRLVSRSFTENETSGSWPNLSSPAIPAPPPYTARSTTAPFYPVTVPSRSLQGGPVRSARNYVAPRHHVEDISRG
ncbi:hypothetical protein BDR07DRAFT_195329 [Suillus spraguei]|nr:hypothetical protein BDR07DRAFT_195329 [Suillus spraguei]